MAMLGFISGNHALHKCCLYDYHARTLVKSSCNLLLFSAGAKEFIVEIEVTVGLHGQEGGSLSIYGW